MKKNKALTLFLLSLLILSALVSHYFHWDDRLVQFIKEQNYSEQDKDLVAWFDDYYAVIQEKRIPSLLKAETSGLTWHEPSNTLFTVTGRMPKIAQLSLQGDLLKTYELQNGAYDAECITALPDGRFAIVDEDTHHLLIFSLPEQGEIIDLRQGLAIDLTTMTKEIAYPRNKNIEGLAWDNRNSQFILAKERDPIALYTLPFNLKNNSYGTLQKLSTDKLFMRDVSGLAIDERTGNLLVLSHESRLMIAFNSIGTPVNFMSFAGGVNGLEKQIKQAEGIAMDKQGILYIVSEPNIFYSFAAKNKSHNSYNNTTQNNHFIRYVD